MSVRWLPIVLMCTWGLMPSVGFAQEESAHCGPPPAPAVPCCPAPCQATLHSDKVILFGKGEICTEPQLNLREIVTRVPTMSVAVEYREEKRCVTVLVPRAREVERVVEVINYVPVTKIDPCTGCPCTTFKAVPTCRTEKVQVFEAVPETKEYTVQVPVLKPIETEVRVTQLTADWSTKAVAYTRYGAVFIPTEIKVPIPCPLPPPPPTGCPCPAPPIVGCPCPVR